MKKQVLSLFAFSFTALAGQAHGEPSWFAPAELDRDAAVQSAHAAYLEGDLGTMAAAIRDGLAGFASDELVVGNLLGLWNHAMRENGSLRSDWELPPGITNLNVVVKRRHIPLEGRVRYDLRLTGSLREGARVEQIRVVRVGGDVILDENQGIGYFGYWGEGKEMGFYLVGEPGSSPPSEGLYLVTLQMVGGSPVQGWFVVSEMAAREAPEVISPSVNETVLTGTPRLEWKDFRSSLYQPTEKRVLRIAVTSPANDHETDIWELYHHDPEMTSIVLGREHPDSFGAERLDPGEYRLQVQYQERRNFGPLVIVRASATDIPFRVR